MNAIKLYIYGFLAKICPETCFFRLKVFLLRWCGAKIGENVRICSSAKFIGTGNLTIGDDVWIGQNTYISPVFPACIEIGAKCDLAPEVMIITGSHNINPIDDRVAGTGTSSSVTVGNGTWIGARSLILPGVSVPAMSLIAAGAVVTRSLEQTGSLYAGMPAVFKKGLNKSSAE